MKRVALLSSLCSILLIGPGLFAQAGQAGAPGAPPQAGPPKSTALVTGRVVDGTTGQPISDAIVALMPPGARGRGLPAGAAGASPEMQQAMEAAMAAAAAAAGRAGTPGQQRVMTGADGRFVFHSLPPGNHQLSASLTGYTASTNVTISPGLAGLIGGVAPAPATLPLPLKEGEFATGVTLRLWKYGVITGTVLDDAGEPAIGLMVQVARRVMSAGRVRYVPAWSARTDDRGAYRISSIVPGDYIVVVPQAQVSMPAAVMSGMMEAATGGGSPGGGFAILDLMSSGVMPMEAMTGGVRIGDYMVASSGSVPLVGPDGKLLAYQTTFYPGAAAPAQATTVTLRSGEERSDVNFQLRLIPTARVSGKALGPDGPLANLGIRLVVPGDGTVSESEFDVATSITRADGSFAFFGVPPGQFLLKAQKQPRPEVPAAALAGNPMAAQMFAGGGPASVKEALFVSTSINVAGNDMDNLTLQLATGAKASGRLEFQSATGRPLPQGQQLQSVTVTLLPVDGRLPNVMAMATPDRANAQGEFQTKGYEPGKYFLQISGPPGWQVKSAVIGGRDVLDAPLEIRDGETAGIVVTYTDKVAQISGTVRSPGETDLSETAVVLMPDDYQTWIANAMNPRRSRTVRATRAGTFTIANVPAGEYRLVALDRAAPADLQDPANVAALARLGARVSVAADAVTVNIDKTRVGK